MHLEDHRIERLPGSQGFWESEWSPDGRYIVARTLDSQALMLFEFNTRKWTELARRHVGLLQWSANGQSVYYYRITEPALMRVRLSDHSVQEIVSLKDIKNTGWAGGLWTGVTPDNAPILLRDTGTQEIYALDWQEP